MSQQLENPKTDRTFNLIKKSEPTAVSYTVGRSSYVVTLASGSVTCLPKSLIKQAQHCKNCGEEIKMSCRETGYWCKYNINWTPHDCYQIKGQEIEV